MEVLRHCAPRHRELSPLAKSILRAAFEVTEDPELGTGLKAIWDELLFESPHLGSGKFLQAVNELHRLDFILLEANSPLKRITFFPLIQPSFAAKRVHFTEGGKILGSFLSGIEAGKLRGRVDPIVSMGAFSQLRADIRIEFFRYLTAYYCRFLLSLGEISVSVDSIFQAIGRESESVEISLEAASRIPPITASIQCVIRLLDGPRTFKVDDILDVRLLLQSPEERIQTRDDWRLNGNVDTVIDDIGRPNLIHYPIERDIPAALETWVKLWNHRMRNHAQDASSRFLDLFAAFMAIKPFDKYNVELAFLLSNVAVMNESDLPFIIPTSSISRFLRLVQLHIAETKCETHSPSAYRLELLERLSTCRESMRGEFTAFFQSSSAGET